MEENFEQNKVHNAELMVEAQFALQKRNEPNITLMSVSDYGLRNKLVERLKEKLPEYQFYDLDLTPHSVVSFRQSLQKLLPAEVLGSPPITYCVNVFGLENSRLASEDGQIVDSGMIAQLNYEREIVFRKPNYLTILWGDYDFFVQLQRQAPDFWSWVTYFFEFKQEEAYEEIILEKEFVPDYSGRVPEREEYIKNLEEKLERLPLNDSDKSRTTRERINLYSLLANEYAEYFDYANSKKYYENALRLCQQLGLKGDFENSLLFGYATLNLTFRHFSLSLNTYNEILEKLIAQDNPKNIGSVYHQIGRVYQEQRHWEKALQSYVQALDWKKKIEQESEVGATYHQIGTLHEGQRQWNQALDNYAKALYWYGRSGEDDHIGGTYHQIGWIYHEQRQWEKALESYKLALDWKTITGQEDEIGITHHQIGMLFEKQRQWDKALESYDLALEWNTRTGQEHRVGDTYHQIGRAYEEQQQWDEALQNYNQALCWKRKLGQEHEFGSTYHHIGMVHEQQQQWGKALKNYELALDLYRDTGHEYNIGSTYHQIGRIYQEQRQWRKALNSYSQALKWDKKTEQYHEMGGTYHQIGRTLEEQRKWDEALKNYNLALDCYNKTGQEHLITVTYHQIGRVTEEQGDFENALRMYEMALRVTPEYHKQEQDTIDDSIQRVKDKLTEKITY